MILCQKENMSVLLSKLLREGHREVERFYSHKYAGIIENQDLSKNQCKIVEKTEKIPTRQMHIQLI